MLTTRQGHFGAFLTALRFRAFVTCSEMIDPDNFDTPLFPDLVLSFDAPNTISVYLWKNSDEYYSIRMRALDQRRLDKAEDVILARAQSIAYSK